MRKLSLVLLVLLLVCCFGGCGSAYKEIYAMDTVITLEVWGEGAEDALMVLQKFLNQTEQKLSVTRTSSIISRLNAGQTVTLDEETEVLLEEALALCAATDGALDIGLYPVSRLWGFTTGDYGVPTAEELETAMAVSGWEKLTLADGQVTMTPGGMIDLGAVAKGWAGRQCVAYLGQHTGVTGAMLVLGGNVQTYGTKADGSPWKVGIQNPAGSGLAGVLCLEGSWAIVTSGGYQRFFREDGKIYSHILDGTTGCPAESGLQSVTIVSADGLLADGLSTALYVMGLEEAVAFWRERQDFEAVFIDDGGQVFVTEGLRENLTDCAAAVIWRQRDPVPTAHGTSPGG